MALPYSLAVIPLIQKLSSEVAHTHTHTQTSAIARKLDMIHVMLLNKADEKLHQNLKALSIPALTYGM